ncbi:MAG: DUF1223 domain-containing protein, partial [Rhizobiales bacterium]|nr:DUF1223 domain-containing protein [Hyphomicrobiales bacterium]
MMAITDLLRWSGMLGVVAMTATVQPATAQSPRAVVELFTSQGCSSCPPADKILGELARDPSVVALTMPIDYWDYLGWKDTLADSRFSTRQKAYSRMRGDRDVYTPQVIVNGERHLIGSDRTAIDTAMRETKQANDVMSVPVSALSARPRCCTPVRRPSACCRVSASSAKHGCSAATCRACWRW